MITEHEDDTPWWIITDENHPYGCEYEPAVVMMRQKVGNLLFTVRMNGERCKWCGEGFVSAKLLNQLDENFSKVLSTESIDPDTKSRKWTFTAPEIHVEHKLFSTAIDSTARIRDSDTARIIFSNSTLSL